MNAKQLYNQYQKDLLKLQKNCKHISITDWLNGQYFAGHLTGNAVKVCENCNKIIEKTLVHLPQQIETITTNTFQIN
jgi:hypothetical protein